jgi:histidine ammonia-lyase
MKQSIELTLKPWSLSDFDKVMHTGAVLTIGADATEKVVACHTYLQNRIARSDEAIYGINTGFGALRNQSIPGHHLQALQVNLMRSHACGAGAEVPPEIVKAMLVLKVRSLSYGHSGVQLSTLERLLQLFNMDACPVVYVQGSLGASGDLAPLAHLCLPLIGEGQVDWKGRRWSGKEFLDELNWKPLQLHPKEGLALLNGTQFMLAYGLMALREAKHLAQAADLLAALSLDGFDGRLDPFHRLLHEIRPHQGQVFTAQSILELLESSEIASKPKQDVQDPYSFRCVPQVHGASRDAIAYVEGILEVEMNSTTDNPNIFPEADLILSGGNFHGQPLAMALDHLALALSELGSISERRVFQLLSGQRGLPPFLAAEPGLHSGLMIAQYTAAGIVSKNKLLCVPATADSIPSSNGQEDHVSMGSIAAVKVWEVVDNLYTLLSIEMLAASQALWFRSPLKTSARLQAVLDSYRTMVPPVEQDRFLHADIANGRQFLKDLNGI